jgi:hypothetical protein
MSAGAGTEITLDAFPVYEPRGRGLAREGDWLQRNTVSADGACLRVVDETPDWSTESVSDQRGR